MTKAVSFIASKGGAGKTTLAWELAIQMVSRGLKVLLVDIDPQGTLAGLYRERENKTGMELHALDVSRLEGRIAKEIQSKEWDFILIDTPGKKAEIKPAVTVADLVVFPLQPTGPDYLAFGRTFEVVDKAGKIPLVAPNRIKTEKQESEVPIVVSGLSSGKAIVADPIRDRVGFGAYGMEGLGLSDVDPKNPGAAEIARLLDRILEITKNG